MKFLVKKRKEGEKKKRRQLRKAKELAKFRINEFFNYRN